MGQQGRSSPGTYATRAAALLIGAALIIVAVGLIATGCAPALLQGSEE
jgi:uncharacterized membrane protein